MNLTPRDQAQLENLGISLSQYERQLKQIKEGIPFMNLARPATLNDGIISIEDSEKYLEIFTQKASRYKLQKFVPASGAATRMFKSLYSFLDDFRLTDSFEEYAEKHPSVKQFFEYFDRFPFAEALKNTLGLNGPISNQDRIALVGTMLNELPFEFGNKPKAILPFHKEEDTYTPLFIHLIEALDYAKGSVHFTVSEDHLDAVSEEVERLKELFDFKVEVTYSFQKKHTDTPALNADFTPARTVDGNLLFRPGGHGALIENLSKLSADFVFIKNIDNISVRRDWTEHHKFKRILAGLAFEVQEQIHRFQREVCESPETAGLAKIESFLSATFGYEPSSASRDPLFDLKNALFRPLRVCAMVRNEGEPGGGPFWVNTIDGERLQIVESAQIDKENPEQNAILQKATHFNPVDIVCGLTDYGGERYQLEDFVDYKQGFIAHKTYEGNEIFALELPGLWNGAMAFWNTLFVEVPSMTFNPVKTVNDLLRESHQNEND
ncbi:MAG: Uncharacterised protein [Flavobacteriaceae bacterium]|jgi:hypothetical protein|nr:DUF4301 family protein [Flavobacteriaceae bacterium]CAI8220482.1 MAG: Uncharacterised protein [Flavobacteriaceae bacterium]